MDTAEVLRIARENLPGRWRQGLYEDKVGNRCAIGHIAFAVDGLLGTCGWLAEITPTVNFLGSVIAEQYPGWQAYEVARWNDAEGRTEDEVIAVFEKAIAKAEEIV